MTKSELELLGIVRHFQRYSHDARADMAASFRLGRLQRHRVGEFFWTTEFAPGIAFSRRQAAVDAARAAIAVSCGV